MVHAAPSSGLPDPKDRLRQKRQLDLAEEILDSGGETAEALAIFDLVAAGEPDNRYALLRLGQTA